MTVTAINYPSGSLHKLRYYLICFLIKVRNTQNLTQPKSSVCLATVQPILACASWPTVMYNIRQTRHLRTCKPLDNHHYYSIYLAVLSITIVFRIIFFASLVFSISSSDSNKSNHSMCRAQYTVLNSKCQTNVLFFL